MKKIFVAIASYQDSLLLNTIYDCIEKCSNESQVFFGIVDQCEDTLNLSSHPFCKNITYLNIDPYYGRGPCWARSIVHSFYNNEDYVLQIDSHTLFDPEWDKSLINQYKQCQTQSAKVILSGYPPAFEIVDNVFVKKPLVDKAPVFYPKQDSQLEDDNPVLKFVGYVQNTTVPIKTYHVAGGFIFTEGNFFQTIPYDPSLYFHGEEQNIAVRAWTNGWDIYTIPNIPIYHLYHNSTNLVRSLHWDKDMDTTRPVRWFDLQQKAKKRLVQLLYKQQPLGVYGLGHIRTLREFADCSGIDYENKKVKYYSHE